MANRIDESKLSIGSGTSARPPKKSGAENMFLAVTGLFDAFSAFAAGEEDAAEAAFRARGAKRSGAAIALDTASAAEQGERALRETTGKQRTAIAKSGVALTGSAERAISESETQGALDLIALKHRGKLGEIEKQFEAESAGVTAKFAKRLGTLGAAQSLLGTATRIKLGQG